MLLYLAYMQKVMGLQDQFFLYRHLTKKLAHTTYCGCAGKTGKEQWMRVPHGEELAIHTGPESCVDSRKAIGEALTGGVWAGLLSRERCNKLQGADAGHKVEGNTGCIATARCSWTLRGLRPRARTQAPCTGTGRSPVWPHSEVRAVNSKGAQQR